MIPRAHKAAPRVLWHIAALVLTLTILSPSARAVTYKYRLIRVLIGGGQTTEAYPNFLAYAPRSTAYYATPGYSPGGYGTYVNLDIDLPDNATIKHVKGYGYDDESGKAINIDLRRSLYSAEASTRIISVDSVNGESSWQSSTISHEMNNYSYVYFLAVTIPGGIGDGGDDLRIWTVEIKYSVP